MSELEAEKGWNERVQDDVEHTPTIGQLVNFKERIMEATLEPEDMPKFLNDLAVRFKNEPNIIFGLAQCSAYIHGVNYALKGGN